MREFRHDLGSFDCYREPITHGAVRIWKSLFGTPGVLNAIATAPHVLVSGIGLWEGQFVRFGPML